jgi:hypothetical protein
VKSIYSDLLGRTAEPAGLTFWIEKFAMESPIAPNRAAIAFEFLSTAEVDHKLLNGNFPGAAGGVGAPGTPAAGVDGLADITGNGWENLYFQGNLSTAAVDSLFDSLQSGTSYDDTIAGMLEMAQYLS